MRLRIPLKIDICKESSYYFVLTDYVGFLKGQKQQKFMQPFLHWDVYSLRAEFFLFAVDSVLLVTCQVSSWQRFLLFCGLSLESSECFSCCA
jgi:hypothetical protein